MARTLLALALLLVLAACRTVSLPVAGPSVLEVLDVQDGDRACYLVMRDDAGVEATLMASFDLCNATWVGQTVRATYEEADVMATACEGDPACPDTERVALVVALEPVDR